MIKRVRKGKRIVWREDWDYRSLFEFKEDASTLDILQDNFVGIITKSWAKNGTLYYTVQMENVKFKDTVIAGFDPDYDSNTTTVRHREIVKVC